MQYAVFYMICTIQVQHLVYVANNVFMNGESTNPNAQPTISIRIHTHNGLKFFLKQNVLYKDDTENKILTYFINLAGNMIKKLISIFWSQMYLSLNAPSEMILNPFVDKLREFGNK